MSSIMSAAMFERTRSGEFKLPEFLKTLAAQVDTAVQRHPMMGGEGYEFVARGFSSLNDAHNALPCRERAFERYKTTLGANDPKTLEAMRELAFVLADLTGKPRPDNGQTDAQLADRACRLIADHNQLAARLYGRDSAVFVHGRDSEATILADAGRFDDALAILDELARNLDSKSDVSRKDAISALSHRGYVLNKAGRFAEAVETYRRALPLLRDAYGPDSMEYAVAHLNYATSSLPGAGLKEEAAGTMREMYEPVLSGATVPTPDMLSKCRVLAMLYGDLGRWDEAEALNRRLLELSEKHFGRLHADALKSLNNLASVLMQKASNAEALSMTTDLVTRLASTEDVAPQHALTFRRRHAKALIANGRAIEAESILIDVEKFQRDRNFSPFWPTYDALADLYAALGRPDEEAKWRTKSKAEPR